MTYRDRRLRKAERLREWADKREVKSDAAHETAEAMASVIPFGQPILVGHHSEGRDRNYRDRMGRKMDQAVEHGRKARDFRSRADGIEAAADRAIYSDDPDAVEQLRERIAGLEADRAMMKKANADYRKGTPLDELGLTPEWLRKAEQAFKFAPGGTKVPFPAYAIRNLTGNIGRQRKRLAQLEG